MTDVAANLLQFINILRANDFSVSISETEDVIRVSDIIGLEDSTQLAAAIRSCVAKSSEQAEVFDELFGLYFNGGRTADSNTSEQSEQQFQLGDQQSQGNFFNANQFGNSQLPADFEGLAGDIARGDTARMEMAIRDAGDQIGLEDLQNFWQEGFFTYRILQELDGQGGRQELLAAIESARAAGDLDTAIWLEEQLERFEQQTREYVSRQLRQRDLLAMANFRRNQIKERSFYRASQEELRQIRREVDRLARKLKAKIALRRRRNRQGQLHLQETIRANLQTGLVPFHLKHRRRKKAKPELVVWFDLSESVRAVSEFMLMFVYSLQDLFQRVRSFGFVADTVELTDLFRGRSFEASFEDVMSANTINVYRHSDYGEALRQFWNDYGDSVRQQTVLIVLGDARSNYQNHEPEIFHKMARRAKHSLWLNPEPRNSWGLGDSMMQDYSPSVRRAATVGNLKQLEQVVEKLVLDLW